MKEGIESLRSKVDDYEKAVANLSALRASLDSLTTAADEAQAISLSDIVDEMKDGDRHYFDRADDVLQVLGKEVEGAIKVLTDTAHAAEMSEMSARSKFVTELTAWMKANGRESAVNAVLDYHLSFFTEVK